jgi:hypothetical protein
MTKNDALFGDRQQLFAEVAKTSVSAACRTFGVHLFTYYAWKRPVDRYGLEPPRDPAPEQHIELSRPGKLVEIDSCVPTGLWDLSQSIYHDGPAWAEYKPPNLTHNYRRWPSFSHPRSPSCFTAVVGRGHEPSRGSYRHRAIQVSQRRQSGRSSSCPPSSRARSSGLRPDRRRDAYSRADRLSLQGWKACFESVLALLDTPHSSWGEVHLAKKGIKIGDLRQGNESELRYFLASVVLQANSDTAPDTPQHDDGNEDDEPDPDERMTATFRAFAADRQ